MTMQYLPANILAELDAIRNCVSGQAKTDADALYNFFNGNLTLDLAIKQNGVSFDYGNALAYLTNAGPMIQTDVNSYAYYIDALISRDGAFSVNNFSTNYSNVWALYCQIGAYTNSAKANTVLSSITTDTKTYFAIIDNDLNIMNTCAPPAVGSDITAYCLQVVQQLAPVNGTIISMFNGLNTIASDVSAASSTVIDAATGLTVTAENIAWELDGAPTLGTSGNLAFQGNTNLNFNNALNAAEYAVFQAADKFVTGCNAGIAQTVKNHKLSEMTSLFENILTVIANFTSIGSCLLKTGLSYASKDLLKIIAEMGSTASSAATNVKNDLAMYDASHSNPHSTLSLERTAMNDIKGLLDAGNINGNGLNAPALASGNQLVSDYQTLLDNLNKYLPPQDDILFKSAIYDTRPSYLPTSLNINYTDNYGNKYYCGTKNLQTLFGCHWETINNCRGGAYTYYTIGKTSTAWTADDNYTSVTAALVPAFFNNGRTNGYYFEIIGHAPQAF